MSNENNMTVYDWDSEIGVDGADFSPLPAGTYAFAVTDLKKEYFSGSAKLPACPRAALTLEVFDPDSGRTVTVYDTLLLCAKMEWKVSSYLRAVGLKKHGEKIRPNWDAMVGKSGVVEVTIEDYQNKEGATRQRNRVKSYVDADGIGPATTPKTVTNANDFAAVQSGQEEEIPFV